MTPEELREQVMSVMANEIDSEVYRADAAIRVVLGALEHSIETEISLQWDDEVVVKRAIRSLLPQDKQEDAA